ncbi:fibropellin-1-like isoform X3 [Mya arenaria]|uniref:fibropellin-1-like isoform X3 n=1 Tax=Mya arenaria TaxID=6604 RepID=UPI0022E3CF70|nr:fibropellin-1-like isoform X3 [Mya arenaria]
MFVRLALVVWFLYASSVIGLNTSCCDFYHLKRQNGELWTCGNCLPGYHFVDDCEFNGGSAKCSPCPYGYFMEARNVFRACRKCKRSCPYNTIINFHCTSTSDLKCGCTNDRYLDKDVCVTKTKCQPGYGVDGTTYEGNTKCVKCPEGTISENNSYEEKCMPDTDDCRSLPCVNNGTCTDLVNDFICTCPKGFSGRRCEHDSDDCVPMPCMNNGTCTDLVNDFKCTCQTGFSGGRCEHDTDDCNPMPCMNNGTCTDLVDDFKCTCPGGIFGRRCELATRCDTQPCQNGGRCVPEGILHLCDCQDGFKGKNCEDTIPSSSKLLIMSIVLGVILCASVLVNVVMLAWRFKRIWSSAHASKKEDRKKTTSTVQDSSAIDSHKEDDELEGNPDSSQEQPSENDPLLDGKNKASPGKNTSSNGSHKKGDKLEDKSNSSSPRQETSNGRTKTNNHPEGKVIPTGGQRQPSETDHHLGEKQINAGENNQHTDSNLTNNEANGQEEKEKQTNAGENNQHTGSDNLIISLANGQEEKGDTSDAPALNNSNGTFQSVNEQKQGQY